MTIGEIHEELGRRGEEKAETTVRHHVNVLKDAGMVEIAGSKRPVAGRGSTTNRTLGGSPTTSRTVRRNNSPERVTSSATTFRL
jgi:repressor of nif and glnA expression